MKLIGICFIVVGVLVLALGGFSYTSDERVDDLGPLKVDADKEHSVPIAPIAGGGALVGGIALVIAGAKGVKGRLLSVGDSHQPLALSVSRQRSAISDQPS